MAYRNPWARQTIARERRYFANNETEMQGAYNEAAIMESCPPIACPNGHQAYMKMSVGAYICPTCGKMRCFSPDHKEVWV